MKNKKLEELLKQKKYDVLQYMLTTDLKAEFNEKEVYELYKYVFSVTEKANSICDPLEITEKDVLDIIEVIGNTLQNNDIDFNELAIKQDGIELQFINQRGKILNTYKMEISLDDTRYQPSNLEYAKENIRYRENRLKEMQKFGTHLIRILVENEELFLEKAKKRLNIMNNEIYKRKNNKIGGINKMLGYKISIIKDTMKKDLMDREYINDENKTIILKDIDNFFNSLKNVEKIEDIEQYWKEYVESKFFDYIDYDNDYDNDDYIDDDIFDGSLWSCLNSIGVEAIIEEMDENWLDIEMEGLKYIDDELKMNKKYLLGFITKIYFYIYDEETDEKFCEILKEVVPQELLSDEQFVLGLIEIFCNNDWYTIRTNVPEEKSIIFCKFFDYIKDNMDPKFSNDFEFLNKINCPDKILFFSDELKSDKQLMLKLIEEYPYCYIWMNKEFKIDDDIIESLIKRNCSKDGRFLLELLEEAEIFEDHEILELVSKDENAYTRYRKLEETIEETIEEECFSREDLSNLGILFLSDELKKDKQLMLKLIDQDIDNYIYMNKEFKIDDDIVRCLRDSIDEDNEYAYGDFKCTLKYANIFADDEIIQLAKQDENAHKEYWDLYKTMLKEEIGNSLEENNKIVTHFGDDLDNKSAIYALQKWAEDNDYVRIGHPIEIVRVPAGQVKSELLNIDTGSHKGNQIDGNTIVIDGDIENGVKSASEALSKLGIYVPEQIVELADTKPNKVSSLDSRSGLALVRYLNGEQLFKLAEAGLLDKSLSDEQLEEFGLVDAHKKQEEIINTAIEKINKYTKESDNGEKIVLAPEQIIAGSSIAYEMGINYYTSASTHLNQKGESDGVTFAITSKPGVKLPEQVLKFGSELAEKYRIDENTSGVFVNPNGQMIVAGGLKNPDFKIENKTVKGMLEIIESKFTGKDLSKDEEVL